MFNDKYDIKYLKNYNKPGEENKKQFTQLTKEEILNFVKRQNKRTKITTNMKTEICHRL
jgi:hypothetical protein